MQVSLVKYHTKAMSTFHQINAYEENGFLVMDMCVSDDGQAINNYMVQNLRKSGEALDEVSPADQAQFHCAKMVVKPTILVLLDQIF